MFRLLPALAICSWVASADRQDPPAPDRADLPGLVDTWYRVLRGPHTLGAVHERLERVHGLPWRYAYTLRAHLEFESERGETRSEELRTEAFLDDALAPTYLEQTAWVGEARSRWTLAAGTLRAELPGDELRSSAAEAQAYGSPRLALYAMRQSGQLAREGRFQIRLLDPRGREAAFEAGPLTSKETSGGPKPATRITFLKPPPAGSPETEWKEAWIDKYGRVLEATLRNGAKIVRVTDGAHAAPADRVRREGRRDPLDKAEALRPSLRPAEVPVVNPGPEVNADTFRSVFADAERLLRRMAEARDADRRDELRATYFTFLEHWKALRAKADPAQRTEVDVLRGEAENLWDGAARTRAEASGLYASASDRLEREECAALEGELGRLRQLRDRIELEHRPELLDVLTWIARAEPLLRRCRDREELRRKRLDLEATSLYEEVVSQKIEVLAMPHEIRLVKRHALAVINGEVYRPGDLVVREGVKVEQVLRQAALVSFRGELRWIPLRSPGPK